MNSLRALLADRRRSQSGSVLSAVLIITAFLAIIAGALMTELSTNFLLSHNLVNRVATEATVDSALELAINQLQKAPLNGPCPSLASASSTLNLQTAVASYAGWSPANCYPTVDARSTQFAPTAPSAPFMLDGTHAQMPGLNDYVVGDAAGNVFDFQWGATNPRWILRLGGSVTATPLVMADPSQGNGQYIDVIPLSGPTCGPAPTSTCLSVRSDDRSATPIALCAPVPTSGGVESQPAVGRNNPNIVFAGDASGNMYVIDTSQGDCDTTNPVVFSDPVVAGPVVFACQSACPVRRTDEVFVVTSNGTTSQLVRLTYAPNRQLAQVGVPLTLPWANPSGFALEATVLPTRLAISFGGGQVAIVQIAGSGAMSMPASVGLPAGIHGAPYWCHCPGSLNLIGVGAVNGTLYVLNTNMTTYASYAGGSAIRTSPAADGAGNWYFAADDGQLYEVQKAGGQTMTLATSFGAAGGAIRASPILGPCQAEICIYLGSADARTYLVSLDARRAELTACISTAPPTCTPGANPRVWARVEVGVAGSPQTVHVQGWSYYAP